MRTGDRSVSRSAYVVFDGSTRIAEEDRALQICVGTDEQPRAAYHLRTRVECDGAVVHRKLIRSEPAYDQAKSLVTGNRTVEDPTRAQKRGAAGAVRSISRNGRSHDDGLASYKEASFVAAVLRAAG